MAESTLKTGARTYSSAITQADNYTRWVLSVFQPYFGKRLLEVGLGHGSYRYFLPSDIDYIGLDIDANSVATAAKRWPADQFIVADITTDELATKLTGTAPDTILCINVLEHVEADALAVANLLSVLRPGGHLLIFVPAFEALFSDLDRMAGHLRRYTRADVPRLAGELAEVIVCRYFNAVGGIGWLLNRAIHHRSLDAAAVNSQIRLFDHYVIPVARALDRLAYPLFGQSLVCVLRKP